MNRTALLAIATLFLAMPALAADGGAATPAAPSAPAAAPAGSAADQDDEDPGEAKDAKPEQKHARRNYIRKSKRAFDAAVHANGKALTDEERTAIRAHWRLSMRLLRIRHVAEEAGDKASVAQADALLAKADAKILAQLKELNAKAPAAGSAGGK